MNIQMSWDCGCTIMEGRCAAHIAMMKVVGEAWFRGNARKFNAVEAHCDGFGAGVGSMGDWSGVRDSTPSAVEAMYKAVSK